MLRNLMILPDGTALFSGADQANAIQSVTLTQCVNSDEDLTLGSVCANMMEATILTPGVACPWGPGMRWSCIRWMGMDSAAKWGSLYWKSPPGLRRTP